MRLDKPISLFLFVVFFFVGCTSPQQEERKKGVTKERISEKDVQEGIHEERMLIADELFQEKHVGEEVFFKEEVFIEDGGIIQDIGLKESELDGEQRGLFIKSHPSQQAIVGKPYLYHVLLSEDPVLSVNFVLKGGPKGMTIHPVSGYLTWTPTLEQKGLQKATILVKVGGKILSQELVISVKDTGIRPHGYFVDFNISSNGNGSSKSPFKDIASACSVAKPGDNIYLRGGIYSNQGYGSGNVNNTSSLQIRDCHGAPNKPITVRPWGNEYVLIRFDSSCGLLISVSSYLVVEGLEIEGPNQKITFAQALRNWWTGASYFTGTALSVRQGRDRTTRKTYYSHHIILRDNIVHDAAGAGIMVSRADYVTVEGNIVYNCAWWSTAGTTAIGMKLSEQMSEHEDNTQQRQRVIGNLIFASESRIYSRVWSKGFATLTIDEGEALLFQEVYGTKKASYEGRYLLKNNFILFNGKGSVSNFANKVDIFNNTYYANATTAQGAAAGLRIHTTDDAKLFANAVDVGGLGGKAYSVGASKHVVSKDNYLKGPDKSQKLPQGNTKVKVLFQDPQNLDFRLVKGIPKHVGADLNIWKKLYAKAKRFGIKIAPTGWKVDHKKMTKWIVEHPPAGATIDYSHFKDKKDPYVIIKNIPASHPIVKATKKNTFILKIRHPY